MSARKAAAGMEAPALTSALQLLQLVAGPEMMAAALPILREQMRLTPDKLADLLHRGLNPDHVFGETSEAGMRGMSPTTLRGMKQRKELPLVIQGTIVNSED